MDDNEVDPSKFWKLWNPNMLAYDGTMLCIGPRKSGKTVLMLDVARKGGSGIVMAICPTPEIFTTYGEHIPLIMCHHHFNDALEQQIEDICTYQGMKAVEIKGHWKQKVAKMESVARAMSEDMWNAVELELNTIAQQKQWDSETLARRMARANKNHMEMQAKLKLERDAEYTRMLDELRQPWSWMGIWDDLAFDRQCMNSAVIAKAVKNGRHYIQRSVYGCQSPRDFKCDNRDQIDILAMSPLVSMGNIKRFMEDYIPQGFDTPRQFKEMLATFSANKWWVIVNRRTEGMKPQDFIFRYRADYHLLPPDYIGSSMVQYMQELFYDAAKLARAQMKISAHMKEIETNKMNHTETIQKKTRKTKDTAASADDAYNPFARVGPSSFQMLSADEEAEAEAVQQKVHMTSAMKRRMAAGHANGREDASFVNSDDDEGDA